VALLLHTCSHQLLTLNVRNVITTGWAKKSGLYLKVDNFATVRDRKARDMSEVSKLCLENVQNLDISEIQYSLCSLHKYSVHLKLC